MRPAAEKRFRKATDYTLRARASGAETWNSTQGASFFSAIRDGPSLWPFFWANPETRCGLSTCRGCCRDRLPVMLGLGSVKSAGTDGLKNCGTRAISDNERNSCVRERWRSSMVEMTHFASVSRLRSDWDDFLFAPIGEDRNGMLLSVLSALARLDLDPWQEAAELARLPGGPATERLASLIAALPDGPSAHRDSEAIAARLIALLPRRAGTNVSARDMLLGLDTETKSGAVMYVIFVSMTVMLGALCIKAGDRSHAPVDQTQAPASSTISPQIPPASPGR